jgi:hypothetical protein
MRVKLYCSLLNIVMTLHTLADRCSAGGQTGTHQ